MMDTNVQSDQTPEGEGSYLEVLKQIVKDPQVYEEILSILGGQTIYIPMLDRKERKQRICAIYQRMRLSRMNHSKAVKAISEQERLTQQHVRIILKGISFP
jgi:Mor family transcriptional regulator